MTPLADLHLHLLAALDDGPRTWEDSLAMCRIAVSEGVRHTVALAHQSERWGVTPGQIRTAVLELRRLLVEQGIPLEVFPGAEVMAAPDLPEAWDTGRLLSIGDHRKYILIEMPHRLFIDLRPVVQRFVARGVRVILAHPEQHPELLHESGRIEELIGMGCLVQVSSGNITGPKTPADEAALRAWFRRGCVHLLGSDGHSPRKRRPLLAAAAGKVQEWVGREAAQAICGCNGERVLRGEVLTPAPPLAERRWWSFRTLFGT
ncbi:Tyrosine-protein phosphatase YwqE [Gemmata obscuriglobus]|uniref:protein-tyrosine-phosphatase n=1 Tax=Gemmata obscuriglobus TaxID=114 RepID=A0A2Z3H1L3_9BACT|nr:CpsB/CapC family capsule biosynthesis tyrosine phosphatase [Gemmata obscuriglobus]AWM39618.1 protein tyrosine phosphatase [Gemmata obscuriglobus]QEG27282.1 Tyrosine-protein phosphatase YwqE [Gemmata obscuriglobus]VTS04079.1 protein-tyrosine-phosphatase : Capsular polysaccharide biosynthesis protein OS=Caldanaerobacter subterraneus subsp. yonseiensis KB-1 GN=O163_11280 PE=4 SV=1 [Gemmata obscuriglobus UQM 2246]